MRIQHIRIRTSQRIFSSQTVARQQRKHIPDDSICMIAIQHARPEINLPANTPPGCHIPSLYQGIFGSLEQFRTSIRRYLIARIQTIQMRDMPMLVFRIIHILQPLLQLIVLSDLHWRQLVYQVLKRVTICLAFLQYPCRMQRIAQCIKSNLVVHRTSCHDGYPVRSMLWRNRRSRHHPTITGMLGHERQKKISRTLQHRIILPQKILVTGIQIMLPKMLSYPCPSIGPHTCICKIHRSGRPPNIRIMVSYPSFGPIQHTGCFTSRYRKVTCHLEERTMRLRQVSHFCRPVVHLRININGVLAVPRCIQILVPYTL